MYSAFPETDRVVRQPEPDYGVRECCIPDCGHLVPRNRSIPVCRSCGVKIAVYHAGDADLALGVQRERQSQREQAKARRDAAYAGQSQVYYIRIGDHIKIGYSTNLKQRISQLRLQQSALLATEPGGRELEKERHRQFSADRIISNREDFDPSPRLMAHIDAVLTEHGRPRITGFVQPL